jgi:hypothetical protein
MQMDQDSAMACGQCAPQGLPQANQPCHAVLHGLKQLHALVIGSAHWSDAIAVVANMQNP